MGREEKERSIHVEISPKDSFLERVMGEALGRDCVRGLWHNRD